MEIALQLITFLIANGAKLIKYGEDMAAAFKRDHEMTPEEEEKFDAEIAAARTDPAWQPEQPPAL